MDCKALIFLESFIPVLVNKVKRQTRNELLKLPKFLHPTFDPIVPHMPLTSPFLSVIYFTIGPVIESQSHFILKDR